MAGGSRDDESRDDDVPAGNSESVVRQRAPRDDDVQPAVTTQAADEQVATERAVPGNAATERDTPQAQKGHRKPPDNQDAPDSEDTTDSRRSVDQIMTDADQRDSVANVRDSAANRRDVEANLDALLKEEPDEEGFKARAYAREDRTNSRHDRSASAEDRTELAAEDPPPRK